MIGDPLGQGLQLLYADTLFNDTQLNKQLVPFFSMFELFRVRKMVVEFWCNDNDDITTANIQYPRLQYLIDQLADGRTLNNASINQQAGRKEVFLKPMQKTYVTIYPKFFMEEYNGYKNATGQAAPAGNMYREMSQLTSPTSFAARNSIQTCLYSSAVNSVYYRYHLYCDFKRINRSKVYLP